MRQRGIDAHSVYDLQQQGWTDTALLHDAAVHGRILVTHNIRHFVNLHRSYLTENRPHAGIVVTPIRPIGTLLSRIVSLHTNCTAEEMRNTLQFI